MKSALASGVLAVAVMIGLSSCMAPPPPPPPLAPPAAMAPAPPPPYFAPVPSPRIVSRHCGPGRHWVRGHHNRWGRWVPGHCAPNRWR